MMGFTGSEGASIVCFGRFCQVALQIVMPASRPLAGPVLKLAVCSGIQHACFVDLLGLGFVL